MDVELLSTILDILRYDSIPTPTEDFPEIDQVIILW